MKILLVSKNGVIVNAIKVKENSKVLGKNFDYNPHSDYNDVMKRMCHDHKVELEMGMNKEMKIIESNNKPFDFLYKKMENGVISDNPNCDDSSRNFKINCRYAKLPITPGGVDYEDIPHSLVSTIPKELYDKVKAAFVSTVPIDYKYIKELEGCLEKLPTGIRERAIYTVSKYLTRRATFPNHADVFDKPKLSHVLANRDLAISWWNKLIGTSHDIYALSEIATLYYHSEEEDKAVDIYESILNRENIDEELKNVLKNKIKFIGRGRSFYNKAMKLFQENEYDEAIKLLDKFDKDSSGIAQIVLYKKVRLLRAECLMGKARLNGDKSLVEEAKKNFYPERYGIKHACDDIRW